VTAEWEADLEANGLYGKGYEQGQRDALAIVKSFTHITHGRRFWNDYSAPEDVTKALMRAIKGDSE
jgi:pantothenate kinase